MIESVELSRILGVIINEIYSNSVSKNIQFRKKYSIEDTYNSFISKLSDEEKKEFKKVLDKFSLSKNFENFKF